MNSIAIDSRLALAIGYPVDRVRIHKTHFGDLGFAFVQVLNDGSRCDGPMQYSGWQRFDHTAPALIWPIAVKFDAFPYRVSGGQWYAHISVDCFAFHATAASASALAVIQYCESKA